MEPIAPHPIRLENGVEPPFNFRFVWDDIHLGQSFTVKGEAERNRARASFWDYHKKNGRFPRTTKFVSRHVGDDIYRIWIVDKG